MSEQKTAGSFWWPLVDHLEENHGITVNEFDCPEIASIADKCRMDSGESAVAWILVNALRHLDVEELKRLRDEIVKRIPE